MHYLPGGIVGGIIGGIVETGLLIFGLPPTGGIKPGGPAICKITIYSCVIQLPWNKWFTSQNDKNWGWYFHGWIIMAIVMSCSSYL